MKRIVGLAGSLTVVLAVSLVGAGACGPTIGATFDDAAITARVKTALLNDPIMGRLRIEVDTFQGIVTLSGDVAENVHVTHAIAIAERIDGVAAVESQLRIVPPSTFTDRF